jgi:hypothetical protein
VDEAVTLPAHLQSVTTFTDLRGAEPQRFYRVIATGE